jgi:hypothetical protein
MTVAVEEDMIMKALFAKDQHLDTALYVPHSVGSGADAYKFYTGPNFIVALKKDLGRVRNYLSENGIEDLNDIEEHDGIVLIELGWEDSDDAFKKIKDLENPQKRKIYRKK